MVIFSVVIPTRNDRSNVLQAIRSILAQTLTDFELIVVDDGSDDDTLVRLHGLSDPRLHILPRSHRGVSTARNAGAAAATGRFLAFLDSDDVASPNWLEVLFGELKKGRAGVVCAGVRMVRRVTNEPIRVLRPADGGVLFHGRDVLFLAGSFAVERTLFQEIGGYREVLRHSENTDLGIRLVQRCLDQGREVAALSQPLVDYRVGNGDGERASAAAVRRRHSARLDATRFFLRHHGQRLRKDPQVHGIYLSLGGVSAARLGHWRVAARFLLRALSVDSRCLKSYLRLAHLVYPGIPAALSRICSAERRSETRAAGAGRAEDSHGNRASVAFSDRRS